MTHYLRRTVDAPRFYKDIQMMTAEGVHEAVGELVEELFPAKARAKAAVLDLAAGQGALSQRIQDLGFSDMTAWELEAEKFRPKDIKVEAVDLNKDFASKSSKHYDLITAVEIIEHLENPFHFLREIRTLLKPDGYAIISTPNIESAVSRLKFLAQGRYRWFDEGAYQEWGHIQPLSSWQMNKALERAGLKVVRQATDKQAARVTIDSGSKNLLWGLAALALYPFIKGNKAGEIYLWAVTSQDAS